MVIIAEILDARKCNGNDSGFCVSVSIFILLPIAIIYGKYDCLPLWIHIDLFE
jgi:hypothetical protein